MSRGREQQQRANIVKQILFCWKERIFGIIIKSNSRDGGNPTTNNPELRPNRASSTGWTMEEQGARRVELVYRLEWYVLGGIKHVWMLWLSINSVILSVTWPMKLSIITTAALSSSKNSLIWCTNGTKISCTYHSIVSSVDQCLGEWVISQCEGSLKCGWHCWVLAW